MGKNKLPKTTLDWAKKYAELGWPVFPCHRATLGGFCACHKGADCDRPGKHPVYHLAPKGFHNSVTDPVKIKGWFSTPDEFNIGLKTGNNTQGCLVVIDVDEGEGKEGGKTLELLEAKYGKLPVTLVQRTGSGGRHFVFWGKLGIPIKSDRNVLCIEAGLPDKAKSYIDIRADGGYIIAAPSNHIKGDYYWENWGADIADLPEWLEKALLEPERPARRSQNSDARRAELPPDDPTDRLTTVQVDELLRFISPDEYDNWMMFGHVLKTLAPMLGGDPAAFEIWDKWSQRWPEYQARAAATQRDKWESFKEPSLHPINLLRKHAKLGGWTPSEDFQREGNRWRGEAVERMLAALPENATEDDAEPIMKMVAGLPEIRQEKFNKQLAERFKWRIDVVRKQVAKYGRASGAIANEETDYGMVVARRALTKYFDGGKHLIRASDRFFWKYNGKYWEPIENGDEVIGKLCLDIIQELGPIRLTKEAVAQQAINLLKKLQACEGDPLRLLEAPRAVINCQNGELWLNDDGTLTLKPHSPDSYMRFCLAIEYDPKAKCPLFDQTVLEIFQKSPEPEDMRRHYYEMCGYAIQPKRDIKQFWLLEGAGENGKSGLINTLEQTMGRGSSFTVDLRRVDEDYNKSQLKHCLLVRDNDMDYKTILPDGILKQLSEDSNLVGRDPYGKPKQFKNCSLPVLLCNKYPLTRDLSHGNLVRAHCIPFRHKFIAGVDMKRGLFERIWTTELPGVLNRFIEGLQRLRQRGDYLEPKDCVVAKQEFLRQANPLPRFLASDACATTLEALRQRVASSGTFPLDLQVAANDPAAMTKINAEIATKVAEAESAGLRQTIADFYRCFWQWCRNEGIGYEKPRKADVEHHLANLGYGIATVHGRKWVEGAIAFDPGDERPVNAF